jgi:hypothetical protein
MKLQQLDLQTLRAACWAVRAARRAGDPDDHHSQAELPRVPPVGSAAERGVQAVLRRRSDSCLVRARVRQAWMLAHGVERDLVIGVRAGGDGFAAHAWLEGDPPSSYSGFVELTRRPARDGRLGDLTRQEIPESGTGGELGSNAVSNTVR